MTSTWKVVLGTAGFVIPATVTFLDVFGYVAKVEGSSMQPVLNPEKQKGSDYVFLNKWAARNYQFNRGEIVSVISPTNPEQKIIKRIIGLPGDDIKTLSYKNRYVVIPRGHLWIEGDHHGQSLDSNLFGPVSMGLVNAKSPCIVWPPSRWQKLEEIYPKSRVNCKPKTITQLLSEEDDNIHDVLRDR